MCVVAHTYTQTHDNNKNIKGMSKKNDIRNVDDGGGPTTTTTITTTRGKRTTTATITDMLNE